jgi:catechol 2,3-dioxygenase-like lactoylglutathione lyase family enzyme
LVTGEEVEMSTTEASGDDARARPALKPGEIKLEAVVVPVADVDRAKAFYESLGWRFDIDFNPVPGVRAVQYTPPGSAASIHFGDGITTMEPGSQEGLVLAVADIDATREDLIRRGIDVSELWHFDPEKGQVPGRDPENRPYRTRASFADPDGNGWVLQEITERYPGR